MERCETGLFLVRTGRFWGGLQREQVAVGPRLSRRLGGVESRVRGSHGGVELLGGLDRAELLECRASFGQSTAHATAFIARWRGLVDCSVAGCLRVHRHLERDPAQPPPEPARLEREHALELRTTLRLRLACCEESLHLARCLVCRVARR